MQENNYTNDNEVKKMVRKSGRTLVLRSNTELNTKELTGLLQHNNLQNGKHFLVFNNIENSKNAFKILKNNFSVRFAYYRVFFTMTGIDSNTDYLQLKKQHTEWLTQNSDAEVLYYKHYMKDNKFIGCGDFTVDTKDTMDKLLDKDGLKNYSFNTLSGTYYRYNKKTDQKTSTHNTHNTHN
jgi:hypothetical protein